MGRQQGLQVRNVHGMASSSRVKQAVHPIVKLEYARCQAPNPSGIGLS